MPVAGFCQTVCSNGCYSTKALAFAFCWVIFSGVLLSLCSYELHRLSHYFQADSYTEFFASPWSKNCFQKCSSFLSSSSDTLFRGLLTPDTLGIFLPCSCWVGCLSVSLRRKLLYHHIFKIILLFISFLCLFQRPLHA